ncbi:MAG: hypothetical protein JO165_04345 [Candidatus Eremiobacteraeota bacterium]|nr:hypothetical protein [Candidatus Eremiobacteraeota bacterium]
MGVEVQTTQSSSGLATVLDTVAAPKTAFERLREQPTWGWAFLIAFVLMILGAILTAPAQQHVQYATLQRNINTSPFYKSLSDAKKADILNSARNPSIVSRIVGYVVVGITLLLIALFNTIVVLIGNAAGRGDGNFKRYWCGSMNMAVPTIALGSVVAGIIAMIRGPESFSTSAELTRAVPSLGSFIHPSPAATAFFSAISVFSLWGLYLNATQMGVNRVSKGVAWATAIVILLAGAALYGGVIMVFAKYGFA